MDKLPYTPVEVAAHPRQGTGPLPGPVVGSSAPSVGDRTGRSDRGRPVDRLLTLDEAAVVLGTSIRFPRRLIAERRIRFVRVGRHVRIAESALREYVLANSVEPVERRRLGRRGV
jgi:excisionase family DNA binding protein